MNVLHIDGSILEGGGQILRNALSLSCILQRPIRVTKIRAGRKKPGLAPQHLFGLNLLQQITNARVQGNTIGSTEIEFCPGPIQSGKYFVDTKTAASVALVLQVALPVLLFGNQASELEAKGGTNGGMAPQIDFTTEIFRPNLEKFGATFDFDLYRRGYFPRGGGHCLFTIRPVRGLTAVDITDFGGLSSVFGWCYVAGALPENVAKEMKAGVEESLGNYCPSDKFKIEAYKESQVVSRESGAGIVLGAATTKGCVLGSSSLLERKQPARPKGNETANELISCLEKKQCTDQYVQDQLIIYMALAWGVSTIQSCEPTPHTLTAIHVAELMTGTKFEMSKIDGSENHTIRCKGVGAVNKFL